MRGSVQLLRTPRRRPIAKPRRTPARWACALLSVAAALAAGSPSSAELLVADPRAGEGLDELREGYRYWLAAELEAVGLATRRAPAAHDGDVEPLLERARREQAEHLLIPDLRLREGSVRVGLRLFDTDEGVPRLSADASGPLASIGEPCHQSAFALLSQLGLVRKPSELHAPPLLGELAAVGRALRWLERGQLQRAWREVGRKLTPTAARLRDDILAAARRGEASPAERARVLAAAGEAAAAWALIAEGVARQEGAARPDPDLLLAAAEVELARNHPREARAHLGRVIELDPANADAQLAWGELLLVQGRIPAARRAFAEAARLDDRDTAALLRLAELQDGDPAAQARTLLEAAERESSRLGLKSAERLARRAAQLSPTLAPSAHRLRARAHARSGRPPEALAAWREAARTGADDAEVWVGIGSAQRALGREDAEASFRRAVRLAPRDPDALTGLGRVVLDAGRPDDAVPMLRSAVEIAPRRGEGRRELARALSATGDPEAALSVLRAAPAELEPEAETLELSSVLLRRTGSADEALAHLEWAVRLDPHDAARRRQLAAMYRAAGRPEEAAALLARVGASGARPAAGPARASQAGSELERDVPGLDGLVLAFSNHLTGSRRRSVAFLGVRESRTWHARLRQWLDPRSPDLAQLHSALERALAEPFDLVAGGLPDDPAYTQHLDRLHGFESAESTDAASIAFLNDVLGTDGVFVAEILLPVGAAGEDPGGSPTCAEPGRLELHLRLLSGALPEHVSILHDRECFAGGLAEHGTWNRRAFAVYGLLLVFLVYPVFRGWGTLVVEIKLPPRTRGFLHIRIGSSPEPVGSDRKRAKRRKQGRLRQILDTVSRYRKNMAGRTTVFRWIPARRRDYYVSVRGPLHDATSKEEIGYFIEEQRFRAVRGSTARLIYDMVPRECAVQVEVLWQGAPARSARVALRGRSDSLRYARGGKVFYYLEKGSYTVCMGALDRAAEVSFEIASLDTPVPVTVDLADDALLQVRSCAPAVDPYLTGDYAAAAAALDAAGETELAHLMRAAHHQQRGDASAAAAAYESAGRVAAAAEILASSSEHRASAALFENAGDYDRAGDAYRAAGELAEAARCYLAAYDYDNAAECFETVGDVESLISIHERTGAFLDAAQLAREAGGVERALENLKQVERRDPGYGEACQMTAEILAERGRFDVAAERLAQAIELAGGEAADVSLHERRAELLDRSGDADGALTAWQTVRRLDPSRGQAEERIAALRAEVEQTRVAGVTQPTGAAGAAPRESRYEILAELGRGGMGVVYKARDTRLGRIVALKRLPDNLRDNEAVAQLFLREARAAAALNHRNIVTVYDAGEEHGVYHITMELLDGLPLNTIQERRGTFGVRDATGLALQVCAGLHYAHSQRIVHRDIKTANLFFTRERVVKIMDFGLAKTIEEVRKSSTVIGGTPYYMAPEQAAGERVDDRTDLYALGVTLFRMLTGTFPFTEGSIEYHHRHTPPPDPREYVAEMPAALADLVLALLEKDPEARPATAAEVATRLQQIRRESPPRP